MNKRKKALKNLEKIVSNMGKNWGYLLWRMTILTHLLANVLNAFGKVMTGTWYLRTEISNVHPVTVNFYRENSNQDS